MLQRCFDSLWRCACWAHTHIRHRVLSCDACPPYFDARTRWSDGRCVPFVYTMNNSRIHEEGTIRRTSINVIITVVCRSIACQMCVLSCCCWWCSEVESYRFRLTVVWEGQAMSLMKRYHCENWLRLCWRELTGWSSAAVYDVVDGSESQSNRWLLFDSKSRGGA